MLSRDSLQICPKSKNRKEQNLILAQTPLVELETLPKHTDVCNPGYANGEYAAYTIRCLNVS